MTANLYALGAILLWATLAPLGVTLTHVPPFLLTGLALVIGSTPTWLVAARNRAAWQVPLSTLALGVFGLFGFHFLLFIALRHAPPVEANLINYLWPLLIVLLAPVLLPGTRLGWQHVLAGVLGFAGAFLAITSGRSLAGGWNWGYAVALCSAFTWALYSLLTRRVRPFPTSAVGLFGLVSGVLSLLCHGWLEESVRLSAMDGWLIAALGLGPLGVAFLLWDRALKRGDARQIGVLSYLTPLLSTGLLIPMTGQAWTASLAMATALIIVAAVLGTRSA